MQVSEYLFCSVYSTTSSFLPVCSISIRRYHSGKAGCSTFGFSLPGLRFYVTIHEFAEQVTVEISPRVHQMISSATGEIRDKFNR